MSGKYRAGKTRRLSPISVLLVVILAFTGIVSVPSVSNATTPTLSSVSPDSGPAAGGNIITIEGTNLSSATAVRIDGVNVNEFTIVSDTEITATVPTRAGTSRTVGQKSVTVVIDGAANATGQVFYTYRPELLPTPGTSLPMVTLGQLASRTQAKPISRSGTAPYTVTGIDSLTGNSYTYTTDEDKTDYDDEEGWRNEGHEAVGSLWEGTSNDLQGEIADEVSFTDVLNETRNDLVFLGSEGNCVTVSSDTVRYGNPPVEYDSYCSVFGPEVYSEAFYGQVGQSLSFEWAASADGDDYEIYAFLVAVSDLSTIPVQSPSNHKLLVHSSGVEQPFTASSGEISASGLYRFRFVNGSYDASGGNYLGSNMYIDPTITVGNSNSISMPNLGDEIGISGSKTVVVTSTSGAEVFFVTSGDSSCSVSSSYTNPNTTLTISWTQVGSCIITASQGAAGAYAAAPSVSKGFDVRLSATVPTAPTITAVTGTDGTGLISFNPPSRDGGAPVSNYEYSLDNGTTWVTLSPTSTSSPITVTGLIVGTTYQVKIRAINDQGNSAASNTLSFTVSSGGGSGGPGGLGYTPKLTHLSTFPVAPRTNTAQVSMFGTYFNTVTEVLVDGKKAEIVRKGSTELVLKLPGGLSGFVDVQIKSTIGTLSLPRHFNFGARTNANRAELIVGGFAHNSRVLTPSMRAGIERWLARHPDLKTITCTGFTSLPRRTTDVALSTNRGTTACDFAKSKRPDLVPSVAQGVEDPRLGSSVRRVRLVLTK